RQESALTHRSQRFLRPAGKARIQAILAPDKSSLPTFGQLLAAAPVTRSQSNPLGKFALSLRYRTPRAASSTGVSRHAGKARSVSLQERGLRLPCHPQSIGLPGLVIRRHKNQLHRIVATISTAVRPGIFQRTHRKNIRSLFSARTARPPERIPSKES